MSPLLLTPITELVSMHNSDTQIVERTFEKRESLKSETITPPKLVVKLGRCKRKEVSARKFRERNKASLTASILKIYVDGIDSGRFLTPQDFIDYARIVFALDQNQQLVITGFRPNPLDFSRLKGLGFILGRNYAEMPHEEIN